MALPFFRRRFFIERRIPLHMRRITCVALGGASSLSGAFPCICFAIQRCVCGSVRSCTSVYTPSRRSAHSLSCSHLQGLSLRFCCGEEYFELRLSRAEWPRIFKGYRCVFAAAKSNFNTPRHGPSGLASSRVIVTFLLRRRVF